MLKLQGAVLRGTESLWIRARCYSSARVKEETRKLWLHEQVELLEVLEARLKQLQTDDVLETVKPKIQTSRIRKFKCLPHRRVEKIAGPKAVPSELLAKHEDKEATQSSRRLVELKEKYVQCNQRLTLKPKLSPTTLDSPPAPAQKSRKEPNEPAPKLQLSTLKHKLSPTTLDSPSDPAQKSRKEPNEPAPKLQLSTLKPKLSPTTLDSPPDPVQKSRKEPNEPAPKLQLSTLKPKLSPTTLDSPPGPAQKSRKEPNEPAPKLQLSTLKHKLSPTTLDSPPDPAQKSRKEPNEPAPKLQLSSLKPKLSPTTLDSPPDPVPKSRKEPNEPAPKLQLSTLKPKLSSTTLDSPPAPTQKSRKEPNEPASKVLAPDIKRIRKLSSGTETTMSHSSGGGPSPVSPACGIETLTVLKPLALKADKKLLLEKGAHQDNLQQTLLAYVDTCLFLGEKERALQCLLYNHHSFNRRRHLDARMYNLVMAHCAKEGNLGEIAWLFSLMERNGVKPNQTSYMAALSCMGRTDTRQDVISRCIQQFEDSGFSLGELFQDSLYEDSETAMALKAIRKVNPAFELPPHPSQTHLVPLLQKFYKKRKFISYAKLNFPVEDLKERFRKQYAMEALDTVAIESVEAAKPPSAQADKARKILDGLRSRWRESLLQSLVKFKLRMKNHYPPKLDIYPFLCVLKDEECVDLLLQIVFKLPSQGESVFALSSELGTRIYNKYIVQKRTRDLSAENFEKTYGQYVHLLAKDGQVNNYLPREYWEKLRTEAGYSPSLTSKQYIWPHTLLVQLGFQMVELLVQVLKFEKKVLSPEAEKSLIPVLYHVYTFRSNKQIGFIRTHPVVIRLLQEASETTLAFDTFVIPMLCPPIPWVSPQFGAYILSPIKLMRCLEGAIQHELLLEECPRDQLYSVMDALNMLGNCPWKVNQPILDLAISIFNDKGDEKLAIPPPPLESDQLTTELAKEGPMTKLAMRWKMAQLRKKAMETYSLRMDTLYKLSIAKHMKDRIFWFPHNMDFRGRTYPCPPHFNHLGSDLSRAILLFAEGKPLGPHGLDWLKIHLVNLTGLRKKSSLKDRLAYADEIMPDILDSAANPLTGKKWWMDSDEPWQTLACCMEIANALRSPDPAAYISYFPVHQDGSCNGLQHYAALGRDVVGAHSVNLAPSEAPQDVYSMVAQQVEAFRKLDVEQGVEIAQILDGFVSRRVVKQTVMTIVYGVTRYGGRLQIEKQLKDIEDFPQECVWKASHYLVQLVFKTLAEMFSGSRKIQNWLTESARCISSCGWTVEWVTPLGLPIIHPYHRSKSLMLKGDLQNLILKSTYSMNQKPDTRKQKNAFPPNFIHSLDSTHMMLTALHCQRQGLTFVSVHDCYWTHALTVDIMNQICREQFVALHKQPILDDLSKFMLQKYCSSELIEGKTQKSFDLRKLKQLLSTVPEKGDFDLEMVKKSTYFFN